MLLLDTNALLWFWHGDAQMGPAARRAVERAWQDGEAAASAISFWEVSMLNQKRRIELPGSPSAWRRSILEHGLNEIPVDGEIGIRANALVGVHADPADRIVVATALEGHRLVTSDQRILDWGGSLGRLDARR